MAGKGLAAAVDTDHVGMLALSHGHEAGNARLGSRTGAARSLPVWGGEPM